MCTLWIKFKIKSLEPEEEEEEEKHQVNKRTIWIEDYKKYI